MTTAKQSLQILTCLPVVVVVVVVVNVSNSIINLSSLLL